MGFIGFYVIAVWDLWDSHGAMGLRCGTYGTPMDLWDCGEGPMGCLGSVGLQCGTFGIPMRLWDCGVGLMGHKLWA